MTSIVEFIKLLEKEISKTNNTIEKINVTSSLEKIIDLITKETIWDLTVEDLKKLEACLNSKNSITVEEKKFLEVFVNMPQELKKLKKQLELGIEQELMIRSINSKITEYKNSQVTGEDIINLEKILENYKLLLKKLKNNGVDLITEIDIISIIMEKNNISYNDQVLIYREINKINNEIFKKHNVLTIISPEYDVDDGVSEEDLVETNLSKEMLQIVFEEFNIDWSINFDENTTVEEKFEKELSINNNIEKLLKYGNFEKMREILKFLKDNNLDFVFKLPEVLTLTLLYSSIEQLEKLKKKITDNNLNFVSLIEERPARLYPTIREVNNLFIKKKKSKKPDKDLKIKSGELKHFTNCVEFLEKHNYNVEEVFAKCATLFSRPIKTIVKAYDNFKLYGFDLNALNSSTGFTVLCSTHVLDKIDIAIESNCLDYYKANLSVFTQNENLAYKIKNARSKNKKNEEIFTVYDSKIAVRKSFRNDKKYGMSKEEIFKNYKAYEYSCPNKDFYDSLVHDNDNNTISIISMNDNIIEKLDSMYRDKNSNIYNFDGVIISRLKVLRYYETLISSPDVNPNKDVLLYAITKLSMLTAEECRKIENCVNKIKFKERILG